MMAGRRWEDRREGSKGEREINAKVSEALL